MSTRFAPLAFLLVSCTAPSKLGDTATPVDVDGDGVFTPSDCDDADPAVHPGAVEICNGRDDNCDSVADDDDPYLDTTTGRAFHPDGDGDGYGDPGLTTFACLAPSGAVEDARDCDDTDAGVHPGATDTWYDGVDENCDGADDFDADGDGYDGPSSSGPDCDDADATVRPGAAETWYDGVDGDCDGANDNDADGDGYDSESHGGRDCDDADPLVNPDAEEVCDLRDDNCDGMTDDECCPSGMVRFDRADGRPACVDQVLSTSQTGTAAASACASRGVPQTVCSYDELVDAVADGNDWGVSAIMTSDGEGCCCPGPNNESGWTRWEPTQSSCEWWPFVEDYLCCLSAP